MKFLLLARKVGNKIMKIKKIKLSKAIKIELIASLILAIFLIVCHIAKLVIYGGKQNRENIISQEQKIKECEQRRLIDGVCLENGIEEKYPVAVMIDNSPEAWSQFGLSRAQIVYNTLVEGGTTRLMAVFSGGLSERIGPVRSARPYYLGFAKELDALYGHSGGSPEAIATIKKYDVKNLEEATNYGPLYFWRDKKILAPHNLFTSTNNLEKATRDFGFASTTPNIISWKFSDVASSTKETVNKISIKYSEISLFDISYEYNTTTETYLRFQNDEPFIDAIDNSQISVKNLIIQFVAPEIHLDSADRLRIETIGTGKAIIIYKGKMVASKWIKEKLSGRTKFFNESGDEIVFLPGNIWVEVIPSNKRVEIN
jgi:serine/threonine protein kinase